MVKSDAVKQQGRSLDPPWIPVFILQRIWHIFVSLIAPVSSICMEGAEQTL